MNATLTKITQSQLFWKASLTGAPGCFGKKLFEYGSGSLGERGRASSYTTLYRFDPGAHYPAWRMIQGTCEIWILRGTLEINGERFSTDEWVQIPAGTTDYSLASIESCEILAIVRGTIELSKTISD